MSRILQDITKSTGVSLTSDFYIRNFYKENKNAVKKDVRRKYSSDEKAYEDSRALRRAAKSINSQSFDEGGNPDSLIANITAYVDTYNNTITSASGSSSRDVSRYVKELKKLTADQESKLQDIGITIEKDGTLSLNSDYLEELEVSDLKEAFDPENGFMNNIMSVSKKIFNKVHTSLYEQLTGNGTMLNVTV